MRSFHHRAHTSRPGPATRLVCSELSRRCCQLRLRCRRRLRPASVATQVLPSRSTSTCLDTLPERPSASEKRSMLGARSPQPPADSSWRSVSREIPNSAIHTPPCKSAAIADPGESAATRALYPPPARGWRAWMRSRTPSTTRSVPSVAWVMRTAESASTASSNLREPFGRNSSRSGVAPPTQRTPARSTNGALADRQV